MAEQNKFRNWVERRATRESLLETQSGALWETLRGQIQDACESFNLHYPGFGGPSVECRMENGKRIHVSHANVPTVHPPSLSHPEQILPFPSGLGLE